MLFVALTLLTSHHYQQLGGIVDFNEVIVLEQEALALRSTLDAGWSTSLNNLSSLGTTGPGEQTT